LKVDPLLTLTGTIQALKTFPTGFALGELAYRGPEGAIYQANIVGTLLHLAVGEAVELDGDWSNHPRYGRQFKVVAVRPAPLTGAEALIKYLSSGLLAGVGPSTAAKIVTAFGERTLEVLNTASQRLAEVRGIGPKKAQAIIAS
jgi:exodeoxyribonuclease V alpha subunit